MNDCNGYAISGIRVVKYYFNKNALSKSRFPIGPHHSLSNCFVFPNLRKRHSSLKRCLKSYSSLLKFASTIRCYKNYVNQHLIHWLNTRWKIFRYLKFFNSVLLIVYPSVYGFATKLHMSVFKEIHGIINLSIQVSLIFM